LLTPQSSTTYHVLHDEHLHNRRNRSVSPPLIPLSLSLTHPFPPGYIGGTVLSRLLTHPSAPSFKITALVRSPEKAAKLRSAANNISTVVGSLSEEAKVSEATEGADVVFSTVGFLGVLVI